MAYHEENDSRPVVDAKNLLAERARAFAAAYLIRLDSNPNNPEPAQRLFEELCDAAMALAAAKGYGRLG